MCTTVDHSQYDATMQAQLIQSDLWEREIVPRLPQDMNTQAKALGALQRRRGITTASTLLRAILSWVLCQRSLRQLGVWAVVLGIADLSEAAWRKRLLTCGQWLNWLLQQALGGAGAEAPRGRRVLIVDGTELMPPGGRSTEAWLAQITYDVGAATMVDLRVGDPHQAETLLGLSLGEGDLVLNDRGFSRRTSIMAVAEQNACQLGRWSQTGVRLQQEDGTRLQMADWLETLEGEHVIVERPATCVQDAQIVPIRVLALRLPPDQAEKARARLRKAARRQGRQLRASTIQLAGWVILLSTLPASYSASELFWLYRGRWQIERLMP